MGKAIETLLSPWSKLETAYHEAVRSLEIYKEALTESLPRNPENFTQLCQLDDARIALKRAEVQSKPSNRKRKNG